MDAIARRTAALLRSVSGDPTEKAVSEEAAFFCAWNFIPFGFDKKWDVIPLGFDEKRGFIPLGFHKKWDVIPLGFDKIPDVILSTGEFYVKNVLRTGDFYSLRLVAIVFPFVRAVVKSRRPPFASRTKSRSGFVGFG